MKIQKATAVLIFIAACSTMVFGANDVSYYKKIYKFARDMQEKRDKVKEISEVADDSFKGLVIDLLDEEVNYGRERNRNIKRDFEEWIYYTAVTAGKLRISEAANKLKLVYSYVDNPIYKGAIVLAIGQTQNRELLPWVNNLMKELNDIHRKGDIKGKEEIVFGTLKALNEFKDPSSFRNVFYAAMPNYSENIRKIALDLLNAITDNPSLYAASVINNEDELPLVYQMMEYVMNSKSPDEGKINTLLLALERGLSTVGLKDQLNLLTQKKIKDEGVAALGDLKASSPAAIRMIERKWDDDTIVSQPTSENVLSQLINIEALQKINTPEANKVLVKKLQYFNDKVKDGAATGFGEKEGSKIVIALIRAIGTTGTTDENAFFELERVRTSKEYGEPIRKEAEAALKNYKK